MATNSPSQTLDWLHAIYDSPNRVWGVGVQGYEQSTCDLSVSSITYGGIDIPRTGGIIAAS